ncbi:MAG: glycosyltransferase [Lachnospiraceae bacterium]|nr:glycosyltransferase [Lachnospiraceae bacterium]
MFKSKMEDYWDMNTIKVSIITVSYNAVDTIEQTILSVLNQSYRNVEYIIIDGQSTDGTQEVIEKYKDKLAYYVSEPDGGIFDAMNKGIKQASGDVIGIINSDDWYELDAVANIVPCFESGDAEIVYGKSRHIYLDGSVSYSENMPLSELWMHMSVSHPSCFVKREVYQRKGLFDTKYRIAGDYEFMLGCYSSGVKFKYIDKVIANFRYGGISTTDTVAAARETLQVAKTYMDKCFDCDRETLLKLWEQKDLEVRLREMFLYYPQILENHLTQAF